METTEKTTDKTKEEQLKALKDQLKSLLGDRMQMNLIKSTLDKLRQQAKVLVIDEDMIKYYEAINIICGIALTEMVSKSEIKEDGKTDMADINKVGLSIMDKLKPMFKELGDEAGKYLEKNDVKKEQL